MVPFGASTVPEIVVFGIDFEVQSVMLHPRPVHASTLPASSAETRGSGGYPHDVGNIVDIAADITADVLIHNAPLFAISTMRSAWH
jgi:hypothetical protein